MRPMPRHVGRALADRLRRHPALLSTADPAHLPMTEPAVRPASRAARLRRMLGAARVTPYQLRRGWLW